MKTPMNSAEIHASLASQESSSYRKRKVVVVDDDAMMVELLVVMLKAYSFLELTGIFRSLDDAGDFLKGQQVDMVFLDVELPDGKGFDIVPIMKGNPAIIVVTGNTEYAYTAFEAGAIDFLRKPVMPERLARCINKVLTACDGRDAQGGQNQMTIPHLFIKSRQQVIRIEIDQILYAESKRDYIKLVLTKNRHYLVHQSLSALSSRLSEYGFMQVHRSYTIAKHHIISIANDSVQMPGKSIPVGKTFKSLMHQLSNTR